MEPKELKLGNYVYIPGLFQKSNVLGIVESIPKEEVKTDKCEAHVSLFEPIELTDKYILKLGNAEIKQFTKGIIVFERFIFQWKESYKYWYVMERHSLSYLTKIEFVHEYQNFIFSLTGQELTIK